MVRLRGGGPSSAASPPWTVRVATEADIPTLIAERDAMWTEMGRIRRDEWDPSSWAYGEWLRERLRNGQLRAFLLEEGASVVAGGAVWLQEVQPRPGHPHNRWGYILSVYTKPRARRKGAAREIMAACVEWARLQGCTRVCLHASHEGRALYKALGFEPTDEMWLDLRPPEARPKSKGAGDPDVDSATP